MNHIPVLLNETLDLLTPRAGQTAVDCTLGLGGHAEAIISKLGGGQSGGRYIGFDVDEKNIEYSKRRLQPVADSNGVELVIHKANFRDIKEVLGAECCNKVDLLLADLGFASSQMDDKTRGFSFLLEAPLDMRMDLDAPVTAQYLVNNMAQRELADLFFSLGEERLSKKIAAKIVELRQNKPITNTKELGEIVRNVYQSVGFYNSKMHPATKVFMALRIAVNGELDALDELLAALPDILNSGGRAGIISFHSLEDRRVKKRFAHFAKDLGWQRITRKPACATENEVNKNPRSRSAKLRVIARY